MDVWIVKEENYHENEPIHAVFDSHAAAHVYVAQASEGLVVEKWEVRSNPLHADEDGLGRYHTDDDTHAMVMGPKPRLTRPSPPGSARIRNIMDGSWTVGHLDEEGQFLADA